MAGNLPPADRVVIVTPAARGNWSGNRVTAVRWAGLLRQLGIRVRIVTEWRAGDDAPDAGERVALFAVHAKKSAASVTAFAKALPEAPIVVLLAGTDIYPTFEPDAVTLTALETASALIALQPLARDVVPPHLRDRVRTVRQSATAVVVEPRQGGEFAACVLAHLRPVKDPLLPFAALRDLPPSLPVRVTVAGRAMTDELATLARLATESDPRAIWLGPLRRPAAKALLAQSDLCIVPSTSEGGANVISEAIAAGTPIAATRIPGNTGLLGDDWPALFEPGDATALAGLLQRCATDPSFFRALVERTAALQPQVAPARERETLADLLAELFPR